MRKLLYATNSIESLNYQLREVTKARGHFPGDDAVVKLLRLAIINIEDKRARERAARQQETGKRHAQPARLIEGPRVMGWHQALGELDIAYPKLRRGHRAVSQLSRDLIATNIPGWLHPSGPVWVSFGDYLDLLRHVGIAANVFPLVAHGAIRLAVAGFAKRQLTGAELREGRQLVAESLEAGAIGLTAGLEYAPGQVADSGELAFLAEPLRDYDSLYATHCRNRAGPDRKRPCDPNTSQYPNS